MSGRKPPCKLGKCLAFPPRGCGGREGYEQPPYVLPSPSRRAQGGGLGQLARTWQCEGCPIPGPGLSEAGSHKEPSTTGPGEGGPQETVRSPARLRGSFAQGAQRLSPSMAHQLPREPKLGTAGSLFLSEGSGEPWTCWKARGQLLRGKPSFSRAKGKSPRTRAAPRRPSTGSLPLPSDAKCLPRDSLSLLALLSPPRGRQLLLSATFSQTSFPSTWPLGWTRNPAPGWQWSHPLALLPNPRPSWGSPSPRWRHIRFWASPSPAQRSTLSTSSFERHADPAPWPWAQRSWGKRPSQGLEISPTQESASLPYVTPEHTAWPLWVTKIHWPWRDQALATHMTYIISLNL